MPCPGPVAIRVTNGADGKPVAWNESRWVDEEFSTLLTEANGTLDLETDRGQRLELGFDLEVVIGGILAGLTGGPGAAEEGAKAGDQLGEGLNVGPGDGSEVRNVSVAQLIVSVYTHA